MYRVFTKTDGMRVYVSDEDILAYEEEEGHVLVITVIGDFEVIDTIEEFFDTNDNILDTKPFSNN